MFDYLPLAWVFETSLWKNIVDKISQKSTCQYKRGIFQNTSTPPTKISLISLPAKIGFYLDCRTKQVDCYM